MIILLRCCCLTTSIPLLKEHEQLWLGDGHFPKIQTNVASVGRLRGQQVGVDLEIAALAEGVPYLELRCFLLWYLSPRFVSSSDKQHLVN